MIDYSLDIGIEDIKVVIPEHYIDLRELARARGISEEKIIEGLGCEEASIPYEETIIDLGARALEEIGIEGISRFYIASESNPDLSKSLATEILAHKLGLRHVETRELQFACLGGCQALQSACEYVALRCRPAVVLAVDRSIYRVGGTAEFTQGAAAVAIKVNFDPKLLKIDFERVGTYIEDIDDFRVPAHSYPFPEVDGHLSIVAYLHAMKQAYEDWKDKNEALVKRMESDILDFFTRFVFHIPYPKIAIHAFSMLYRHERLGLPHLTVEEYLKDPKLFEIDKVQRKEIMGLPEFQELYNNKVKPGLAYNPRIGNCYTASVFISLASVLENINEGDNIGIGGYGSGCGAMAIRGVASGEDFDSGLRKFLRSRKKLDIEDYLKWRENWEKGVENAFGYARG
ncbi:MAG: hydroxymethylglutaryl-CoA synthase family protein [Candidatus Methanospirareceae archaeon]